MAVVDLRVVVSRLDPRLRQALERAVALGVSRTHPSVGVEHWLNELTAPDGLIVPALRQLDVDRARVAAELARALDRRPGGHDGAPTLSPALVGWIEEAWLAASLRFGRNLIAPIDLLVAMTTGSSGPVIREMAPSLRFDESKALSLGAAERELGEARPGVASAASGELERYTTDLTAQARRGELDPVSGRDAELRQVIDVLMRRRQNNPILVGEAGVGKTALVEALALRVVRNEVPPLLQGICLRALDLGLLQAGAGVKGEFERRLTGVIAEIKTSPTPIIVFIDEAHTMIGAGNQPGQADAANLLKPALARGELRTIAATTWSEYKRHIERDPALTRRFQVIKVDEPAEETASRMLRGLVPGLEAHHRVRIRDEALTEAVRLSARFLPDRQLPDKAVSVLDTACASVAISQAAKPAAVEDLAAERHHLETERAALLRDGDQADSERLAWLDERIVEVAQELETLDMRHAAEAELVAALATPDASGGPVASERHALETRLAALQGEEPLIHRLVDRQAVASVIARWTGVPMGRLMRDTLEASLSLERRLGERIIGQEAALKTIADAMRSSAAKLADPRKPPGVFLMVGTSGVGKTETAMALAELLHGGEHHLTVISMSEFKEEHKLSSLVGAPPGYVGYGEGGVLTEAVRRRPYGILLLDEVEKAHPGVQDVFYQVLDKGVLRDSEGRDVDFRNTTIMLTANAGAQALAALAADPQSMPEGEALVDALRPELLRHFKPAFLGRVTIVPYLPLTETVLRDIAELQLRRVTERLLEAHGAALEIDPTVEDRIVARCLAGDIGARAIDGVLKREILPALSDFVLEHTLTASMPEQVLLSSGRSDGFHVEAIRPGRTKTAAGYSLTPAAAVAEKVS